MTTEKYQTVSNEVEDLRQIEYVLTVRSRRPSITLYSLSAL